MKIDKKTIVVAFIVIVVLFLIWTVVNSICWFIVELPVKSSPHTLTLSRDAVFGPDKIVIKHYIDDEYICDYELNLKVGLDNETSQKYELPYFKEGSVDVYVYTVGVSDGNVLISRFSDAKKLYKKGLLIHFSSYYFKDDAHKNPDTNRYTYFVSGNDKRYYLCKAYTVEWTPVEKAPRLKRFISPDRMAYVPTDFRWKQNRWDRKIRN